MVANVKKALLVRGFWASSARASARRAMSARALLVVVLAAMLVGVTACGATQSGNSAAGSAAADPDPPAATPPAACSTAVLDTLTSVLGRVYREGIDSERTFSAQFLIAHSRALRAAVESASASAARAAAHALLATGHMTNLLVTRGAKTLVDLGGPALAPLQGAIVGAHGQPIASYVTSVWADNGFLTESGGITEGLVALRAGSRNVGGSPSLGVGALAREGTLTRAGVAYRYTSFAVHSYPAGSARVYLLMPYSTIDKLCGSTPADTAVNTLRGVANLIYTAESGHRAQAQVHRAQRNRPLLEAVAHHDAQAARLAIDALLNQHIVRVRVDAGGQLLSDVGGPYVLAPVSAPLRQRGHTIGTLELSIQDDEGYLRLARRLAGLDVLMYMNPSHPQLVKDSLGPAPGPALAEVPAEGSFNYKGHSYRVFTVNAQAFPSGPLVIRVLVPLPYR